MEMIIGAVLALLVVWAVSVHRRLTAMNENVNSAMRQIGVQLSSCFDALTALIDLAKRYSADNSQFSLEKLKLCRGDITEKSTPNDVLRQQQMILEALCQISETAKLNPDMKADEVYIKCMTALDSYEKMVKTGRLIYNDSVTKINRELLMFPTSLPGHIFGFRRREYLEEAEEKQAFSL